MKKSVIVIIALAVVAGLFLGYKWLFPDEYEVGEDEIALKIRLNLQEDIGLVVYDYTVDGHQQGGGVSNANRTMIKRNEELITTWNREELKSSADKVSLNMRFRIITEYTDPNFENIYPEEITVTTEPISWDAYFGKMYDISITGNKTDGYTVKLITE